MSKACVAPTANNCAAVLEQHLGRQQALRAIAALESAALQRFLAARRSMAPALAQHLQSLQRQIAELEL